MNRELVISSCDDCVFLDRGFHQDDKDCILLDRATCDPIPDDCPLPETNKAATEEMVGN